MYLSVATPLSFESGVIPFAEHESFEGAVSAEYC
jgi:hypothetical protein